MRPGWGSACGAGGAAENSWVGVVLEGKSSGAWLEAGRGNGGGSWFAITSCVAT